MLNGFECNRKYERAVNLGGCDEFEGFDARGMLALHRFKAFEKLREMRVSVDKPRYNAQTRIKKGKINKLRCARKRLHDDRVDISVG
jgi:hypothetical protein